MIELTVFDSRHGRETALSCTSSWWARRTQSV